MCGRTAQTQAAVMTASSSLQSNSYGNGGDCHLVDKVGLRVDMNHHPQSSSSSPQANSNASPPQGKTDLQEGQPYPWRDNFNLCPGHDAVVFTMDAEGNICMDRKVWGLVPKHGTEKSPLPKGPSKHFANLMFNARSDTLFAKPTFSRLLNQRKTCLVAFDGFFEWKADALPAGKGKKQPFYVYRNNNADKNEKYSEEIIASKNYLLMAGLWESVSTGWPEQPTLDTFTILTTEVCDPLQWLHTRMPVCVWDEKLALDWLKQPSVKVEQALDQGAQQTPETFIKWHAVTPEMNSIKYRKADAIKAVPKPKSVKSFFVPVQTKGSSANNSHVSNPSQSVGCPSLGQNTAKKTHKTTTPMSAFLVKKRPASPGNTTSEAPNNNSSKLKPSSKKQKAPMSAEKKGTITSFFSPKKS